MKYRLTLSPEAAALLDELYESGKLADIGVTALTEAKDEEAEAEAEEQRSYLLKKCSPSYSWSPVSWPTTRSRDLK